MSSISLPSPVRRATAVLGALAALAIPVGCSADDVADPASTAPSATDSTTTDSSTTGSPTSEPVPALELAGTSWQLVAIERDDETIDASGDVPAVVSFTQEEIEAYDGVNTAAGSYEIDGGRFTVDALFQTEIGDPVPALAQYQLFDLLQRGGTLVADAESDELRLDVDDTTTLVFERTAGGAAS